MTAITFLLLAWAMYAAWTGRRSRGLLLFGVAFVLALVWFGHHLTDALALEL